MGFNSAYMKTPSGILKVFEIVFVIIAFGILRGAPSTFLNVDLDYFAVGALVMGMVITTLLFICYLMGNTDIQNSILEPALNFLLFVFLVVAGSVGADNCSTSILIQKSKTTEALVMCSFTIMAGLAYGADFVLSVLKYRGSSSL